MKINPHQAVGRCRSNTNNPRSGYTLIELMFASGIMVLTVMALFAAQLIGLRLGQLVDSKSGASDSSRSAIQNIAKDIRTAKMWSIGNLDNTWTNFVTITNGPLQGSALQLCDTTNGSQFTIYYFTNAGNNNSMLMCAKIPGWHPTVICSNLIANSPGSTNFTAEDYSGTTHTNTITNVNNYKNIIHVKLEFCQFLYPLTVVGTNGLYDYYKMEFRATPHLPE